jgi:thioredoxin reductase
MHDVAAVMLEDQAERMDHSVEEEFPVVIIGSGPIGLAAAAHLVARNEPFLLLEAGSRIAASVAAWGHVRLFTPWRYNLDPVATTLLTANGWHEPDPEGFPTGAELIEHCLEPLAALPAIASNLRLHHRVTAVARRSLSRLEEAREDEPFVIEYEGPRGTFGSVISSAVIDASGSWQSPNPVGSNGLKVPGEREQAEVIRYGVPDVLGSERSRYAGRRVLVIGSGHSALNSLTSLSTLRHDEQGTEIHWALRRPATEDALDGCADDPLTERTLLRRDIRDTLALEHITAHPRSRITRLERSAKGIVAWSGPHPLPPVDQVIVATGFRPDHSIARELRLDLQSVYESTYALAPLIDPEVNACGTVPPHGLAKLAHPEPDYYVIGMKSYGRAPTFLMYTGYEQVRSIVCALTGDEAALEVHLTLPERGLCAACTAFLDAKEKQCGCSSPASDDACCDETDGDDMDPQHAMSSAA